MDLCRDEYKGVQVCYDCVLGFIQEGDRTSTSTVNTETFAVTFSYLVLLLNYWANCEIKRRDL